MKDIRNIQADMVFITRGAFALLKNCSTVLAEELSALTLNLEHVIMNFYKLVYQEKKESNSGNMLTVQ